MSAAPLRPNLAAAAEEMAFPAVVPVSAPLPIANLKEPQYPLSVRLSNSVARTTSPPDLFRNPRTLMPLLSKSSNYVVYFIAAHGLSMVPVKMKSYSGTPYSVIQTGGGDATGCPFYFGSFKLLRNLFSINLPYSFQYLLGLYNDRLPQVFRDLIYSTSDEKDILLPNRHLSFTDTPKDKPDMGVFVFDPSKKKAEGAPLFERWSSMESMFTRMKGTTLSEVIDTIMTVHTRSDTRPAIFVLGSCANLSPTLTIANKNTIVSHCARCHFYSKTAGYGIPYYTFDESAGPQPNLTKPMNTIELTFTKYWHELPPGNMLDYYKRKETNTAAYLEKKAAGKVKLSGQRGRWLKRKTMRKNGTKKTRRNRPLTPIEEYPALPNYESPSARVVTD